MHEWQRQCNDVVDWGADQNTKLYTSSLQLFQSCRLFMTSSIVYAVLWYNFAKSLYSGYCESNCLCNILMIISFSVFLINLIDYGKFYFANWVTCLTLQISLLLLLYFEFSDPLWYTWGLCRKDCQKQRYVNIFL